MAQQLTTATADLNLQQAPQCRCQLIFGPKYGQSTEVIEGIEANRIGGNILLVRAWWLTESRILPMVLHRKLGQANQKQDVMLFSRKVSRAFSLAGRSQILECGAR